jgi:hypothetical protein
VVTGLIGSSPTSATESFSFGESFDTIEDWEIGKGVPKETSFSGEEDMTLGKVFE